MNPAEGPHRAEESLLDWIATSRWTVSVGIDRTGIRLHGTAAGRNSPPTCRPAGCSSGPCCAISTGDLVVMGPDRPITGGYLQPLTVGSRDLWKLAQLAPGDEVTWRIAAGTSGTEP